MSRRDLGISNLCNTETGTNAKVRCLRAGCGLTYQLLDNKLTFGSHRRRENVRFLCRVKKEVLCLNGNLQCCKVIAIAREGNAFLQTYPSRIHSIFIFIELTKTSVKVFYDDSCQRSCDAILAQTAEFWLFTTSRKSHWRSFLIKKKHGKSRKHSISKQDPQKETPKRRLWACQPFSQEPVLTGSIPKCDDRPLGTVSLHLENISNSCPSALCLGHRLLGTGRIKMKGKWSLDELSSYVRIKTQFALICADLCMSPLYGCIHL